MLSFRRQLAHWLSARGHEAVYVAEMGMQAASDRLIWDCALAEDWVIITKDEDFAQRKLLARQWFGSAGPILDVNNCWFNSKRLCR